MCVFMETRKQQNQNTNCWVQHGMHFSCTYFIFETKLYSFPNARCSLLTVTELCPLLFNSDNRINFDLKLFFFFPRYRQQNILIFVFSYRLIPFSLKKTFIDSSSIFCFRLCILFPLLSVQFLSICFFFFCFLLISFILRSIAYISIIIKWDILHLNNHPEHTNSQPFNAIRIESRYNESGKKKKQNVK